LAKTKTAGQPRIYLPEETKKRLDALGRKGDNYGDIVSKALDREFEGLPVEVQEELRAFMAALDQPFTNLNVSHASLRGFARLGAALNYRGTSWKDWGVEEAMQASIITFFEDDDPKNARMRLVLGGLKGLIEIDGLEWLEPHLTGITKGFLEGIDLGV